MQSLEIVQCSNSAGLRIYVARQCFMRMCIYFMCAFYASVCTLAFMLVYVGPYYKRYKKCGYNKRYIRMGETVHMRCRENRGHGVKIIARNRHGGCLSPCEVAVYGEQSEWNK